MPRITFAFSHFISSVAHLTGSELRLLERHLRARKFSWSVQQKPLNPQFLQPHIYDPLSTTWVALQNGPQGTLERGSVLNAISWNLCSHRPDPAARASAALEHLRRLLGNIPQHQVVMLQEIGAQSLRAMLENPWVQNNFILSDVHPPESIHKDIPGESFVLRCTEWEAKSHFTLMMVSRDLGIMDCFRVPFVTRTGRDALVADIPLHDQDEEIEAAKSIRLCTTHLEPFYAGKAFRLNQLALISNLLKGIPVTKSWPIAGLVGGDMNADPLEHELHRANDVGLKDVWEDIPQSPVPTVKPFLKDPCYGRAKGHTYGYQSISDKGPAMGHTYGYQSEGRFQLTRRERLDKFLYTGSIETLTPTKVQDVAGRLGRLGLGLKTKAKAWECNGLGTSLVRGGIAEKARKKHFSDEVVKLLQGRGCVFNPPLVRKNIKTWVSDHFGIAVRVKVL